MVRRVIAGITIALVGACSSPTTPTPRPSVSGTWTLDVEKVMAALNYWRDTAGITYVLVDDLYGEGWFVL